MGIEKRPKKQCTLLKKLLGFHYNPFFCITTFKLSNYYKRLTNINSMYLRFFLQLQRNVFQQN